MKSVNIADMNGLNVQINPYHVQNARGEIMKNKKLEMDNIFCTICNTNKAELLHHTDYKNSTVVPVCEVCHKKIHMAKRKPNHFSSSKIFKYIPKGTPTSVSITMTPKDHYIIQHIVPGASFSQNLRIAYGEYINYEKLIKLKIGKYYFTLRKKYLKS